MALLVVNIPEGLSSAQGAESVRPARGLDNDLRRAVIAPLGEKTGQRKDLVRSEKGVHVDEGLGLPSWFSEKSQSGCLVDVHW